MKIYIVTEGDYSDYHIEKVFLDKERADEYVKIYGDKKTIEEYDAFEGEIKSIAIIEVWARFNLDTNAMFEYKYVINQLASADFKGEETRYYELNIPCSSYQGYRSIYLSREINQLNFDEAYIADKYKKVVQDIQKQIIFLQSENMSCDQINEIIKR